MPDHHLLAQMPAGKAQDKKPGGQRRAEEIKHPQKKGQHDQMQDKTGQLPEHEIVTEEPALQRKEKIKSGAEKQLVTGFQLPGAAIRIGKLEQVAELVEPRGLDQKNRLVPPLAVPEGRKENRQVDQRHDGQGKEKALRVVR